MYDNVTLRLICVILAITTTVAIYQNIKLTKENKEYRIKLETINASINYVSKQMRHLELTIDRQCGDE